MQLTGPIKLAKVEKANNIKLYRIEKSFDINDKDALKEVKQITKTKYSVTGLTSGTKYWFQVRGLGTAGEGPLTRPGC